jgi:hypothetical protein
LTKQKPTETGVLELAVEELSKLTPDQIAERMRKRSIGGRPGTVGNCPLARLFQGEYGGQFIVGPKFVCRRSGSRLEKIPTPEPLKQFLRGFDLSRYPDLIMPPPRVLGKTKKRSKPKVGRKPRVVRNHPAVLVGRW